MLKSSSAELWSKACVLLKKELGDNTYQTWIYPLILLEQSNENQLFFETCNPHFSSIIKKNYAALIDKALAAVSFKGQWDLISKDNLPPGEDIKSLSPDRLSLANRRLERFVQLELFPNTAVVPNLAAQSLLFMPVRKGKRLFFKEWQDVPLLHKSLAQQVQVNFKFEQMDQMDLTGWMALIRFAHKRDDLVAAFSGYEFLRAIGKNTSSRDYLWLQKFIDRISSTQVRIRLQKVDQSSDSKKIQPDIYQEALAPQATIASQKQLFALTLSRPLLSFFGVSDWSFLNFQTRLALGNNQWAQSFQAFLCSTRSPFFAKVETLYRLWGSAYPTQSEFIKKFRPRVIKPLSDTGFLKKVTTSADGKTYGFYWRDDEENKALPEADEGLNLGG